MWPYSPMDLDRSMGLDRPIGNIIFNTKRGQPFRADEDEFGSYILPDPEMYKADEPRTYYIDNIGKKVTVGKYTKDIVKLSSIKF